MSEPSVTKRAFHFTSGSNLPITRIVIHDEEFPVSTHSAEDVAAFFATAASAGSAHYVVDADSEQHCLPDNVIAWHAPPNKGSIGIEMDGYARFSPADWQTPGSQGSLRMAAKRTAELCKRYSLPIVWLSVQDLLQGKKGITSHVNVSTAWKESDHSDPGPQFPVDQFIQMVKDASGSPAPTPVPTPIKVEPMFNPPIVMEPIVAALKCPTGGEWLLAESGAIYSFDAPDHGGAHGQSYFAGKKAARLETPNATEAAAGRQYTIISTDGSRYSYPN